LNYWEQIRRQLIEVCSGSSSSVLPVREKSALALIADMITRSWQQKMAPTKGVSAGAKYASGTHAMCCSEPDASEGSMGVRLISVPASI
jgi:hypothetical protein